MKRLSILLVLLTFPLVSHGASQLNIAKAFNILAINGTSYSSGIFDQNRQLKLRVGKNLLVIEYEEEFESDDGDLSDFVKSDPFLLEIYLKNDKTYFQQIVKPANVKAAYQYAKQPLFEIVEMSKGKRVAPIPFKLVALASDKKAFLVQQSRLRQNATLDLSHPDANSSSISNQSITSSLTAQSNASRMLHYWWQQATPAERQAFLESISSN